MPSGSNFTVSAAVSDRKIPALIPPLLRWYSHTARDLPWRQTRDPYAVWISEIMLQQTQVKTVIPYWRRWMRELPTIRALAQADPARVHKLWEGLGYYSRARNLQQAARLIRDRHAGRFPRQFEDVLELPGIGRYTAGAICSIAFYQPTPVLDGNIVRVLTRLFAISRNPREKRTNDRLWRMAAELVSGAAHNPSGRDAFHRVPDLGSSLAVRGCKSDKPATGNKQPATCDSIGCSPACSQLNQALMELGALICTPKNPKCQICPVRRHCAARYWGRVERFPNLRPRNASISKRIAAFVVSRRGRFLVRQRPPGVVNAHLWEFPNAEWSGKDADLRWAARRALRFTPASLEKICEIPHSITRYRIRLEAFRAAGPRNGKPPVQAGLWLRIRELDRCALPSAHRKILDRLQSATR